MNKYEAMIIFREDLKDADWDGAVDAVRAEIEKLGGKVASCTRLGKREFARPMQKQLSGHYGLIAFQLEGDKVGALQARLKLDEQVFRVQVVTAPAAAAPSPSSPPGAPIAPRRHCIPGRGSRSSPWRARSPSARNETRSHPTPCRRSNSRRRQPTASGRRAGTAASQESGRHPRDASTSRNRLHCARSRAPTTPRKTAAAPADKSARPRPLLPGSTVPPS